MTASNRTTLTQLRTIKAWHATHVDGGGVVFPTYASLQWFIRRHHNALVASKSFIPGKGGRASLVTPEFESAVLQLLTSQITS